MPDQTAPTPPPIPAPRRHRIAVLDGDAALLGLVSAWLADSAEVVARAGAQGAPDADLLLVDVPFPRRLSAGALREIAQRHPDVPVVALSPSLLPGVASRGEVARQLGVAAVLPKPLPREALLRTVQELLGEAL